MLHGLPDQSRLRRPLRMTAAAGNCGLSVQLRRQTWAPSPCPALSERRFKVVIPNGERRGVNAVSPGTVMAELNRFQTAAILQGMKTDDHQVNRPRRQGIKWPPSRAASRCSKAGRSNQIAPQPLEGLVAGCRRFFPGGYSADFSTPRPGIRPECVTRAFPAAVDVTHARASPPLFATRSSPVGFETRWREWVDFRWHGETVGGRYASRVAVPCACPTGHYA